MIIEHKNVLFSLFQLNSILSPPSSPNARLVYVRLELRVEYIRFTHSNFVEFVQTL